MALCRGAPGIPDQSALGHIHPCHLTQSSGADHSGGPAQAGLRQAYSPVSLPSTCSGDGSVAQMRSFSRGRMDVMRVRLLCYQVESAPFLCAPGLSADTEYKAVTVPRHPTVSRWAWSPAGRGRACGRGSENQPGSCWFRCGLVGKPQPPQIGVLKAPLIPQGARGWL